MKTLSKEHKEALKRGWVKRKERGLGIPWNKGKSHSEETKKVMKKVWAERKALGLGIPWNKGKKLSAEHASKCRIAMLGKKHSEETKKKMSKAKKGHKNCMWKGGKAGYRAVHQWVERAKGKAKEHKCVFCGKQAYHWANIDHKYSRKKEDYTAMCVKCHKKFDK